MNYFWAFLEYGVIIGVIVFLLFHRVGIYAATPVEEINDLDERKDETAQAFSNPTQAAESSNQQADVSAASAGPDSSDEQLDELETIELDVDTEDALQSIMNKEMQK